MKIAIIGAGITGLTLAYELSKRNHQVFVFEKNDFLGGLDGVFEIEDNIFLEHFYHHLFADDESAKQLIKELGISNQFFYKTPQNAIFYQNQLYPFSEPLDLLRFTPLSFINRLRVAFVSLLLKTIPFLSSFENISAIEGSKKFFGKQATKVIWEPLLRSKFEDFSDEVSFTWLMARIKKRSSSLGYFEGGFKVLIDALANKIKNQGGKIFTSSEVKSINHLSDGKFKLDVYDQEQDLIFDKVIFTGSNKAFVSLCPFLSEDYKEKLSGIKYLAALNLILVLKHQLNPYYWVNINEPEFPFIGLIEHTNFIKPSKYNNKHIVYLTKYLKPDDELFTKPKEEILEIFLSYIKKINPDFDLDWAEKSFLFKAKYAQPVMTMNYKDKIPDFVTPIPNLYFVSMCQVYPWDRGTNYAVEIAKESLSLIPR